jgi:hypothetical protein
MSDIDRGGSSTDIMLRDEKLRKFHEEILISEKLNQIKQLDLMIDKMKTVDMRRLELKQQTLAREIEELRTRTGARPEPVDVELVEQ